MLFLLLILFLTFPKNLFANSPNDITITDYSSNSDPEWVQLTNNTDHNIDLTGWALRDENNDNYNTDGLLLSGCLSPGTFEIFNHNSGWLNNGGDIIRLYDQNDQLINTLTYSQGTDKEEPGSTNTCIPETITPIPTLTSENITINPDSDVTLNEIMPYSATEWIEIYNNNDFDIKLIGWTIEDSISNTKNIPELIIEANSLAIFEFSSLLNNDQSDTLNLYNQEHILIDTYTYPNNSFDLTKSWSKNNTWCKTDTSKGAPNNSCLSPTSTPTPTSSPTLTPSPTLSPTPKLTNSPTPSPDLENKEDFLDQEIQVYSDQQDEEKANGSVLGESQDESKNKKNYFPLILIISGGFLLLSPLIITTLKQWRSNSKK